MREMIKEGRDVNQAIDLACQALGVERETVEFEIISLPKRGFLGLRNTLAKVRVYIDEPEPVVPVAPSSRPVPPVRAPQSPARPAPQPRQEQRPAPIAAGAEKKPAVFTRPMQQDLKFIPRAELEGKSKIAAEYLDSILCEIGVQADISVATTESGIILRLSGDGLGVIIGRRGETLDALQYLSGLVANRGEGDYLRVTIDSGNYREKRERTLQQLARKISATAVRYGRSSTLEPMNPYERRIIHATVSEIEGATSSSVGEEPNRRVVISSTNPRSQTSAPRAPRPLASGGAPNRAPAPAPAAGGRPPRRNDSQGGARPPRRNDNRDGARVGDRPAFRSDRPVADRAPTDRAPAGVAVKPTSTDLDRGYAEELARKPELGRASEADKVVRAQPAPTREKTPEEGKDMPLYGKIDI